MATQIGVGFSQLVNSTRAGRQAAKQAVESLAGQKPDVMVLFSTADKKPEPLLAGVRSVAAEAPLIGGVSTGVIVAQGVFSSGVAIAAIRSDEIQVALDVTLSGPNPVKSSRVLVQRLMAQRSEAHQSSNGLLLVLANIHDGDAWSPALAAMGNEAGPLYRLVGGRAADPSGRIEHSIAVDHPLGLPQIGREYIVRDPTGAQPDGALVFASTVPEYVIARIMVGNRETMLEAAREAAVDAVHALEGKQPLLALVFSCISRLNYLGPAAQEEVAVIREAIGPETPMIGLSSFGEIAAQVNSPVNLHNKTIVVGVIGEA